MVAAGAAVAAGGALALWQWAGARDWSLDAARRDLWQAAWRTGLERPLTGVGPIGYARALNAVRDPSTLPALLFTPHNVPLMAWAEGGLLGVVALAVLVAALLRVSYRRWRSTTGAERVRIAGAFAGLLGLSAHSMVDTFFGAALGTALILPLVTLAAYLVTPLEPEARLPRLHRAAPALLLALVGLAVAGWLVSDVAQHRFTRSLELAAAGDLPAAVEAVESARRLDPAMDLYAAQEAQYLGELAAQDAGYLDDALAVFETALGSEDSHDVLHANYAALLAQAGEYGTALREMQRAATINPAQPAYALWSGMYAEELGDRAQALSAYRDALERAPGWVASGFWELSGPRREAQQAFLAEHGLQGIPLDALARTPAPCWPTEGASQWWHVRVTAGAADSTCEAQRALAREEADPAQAARLLDRAVGIQPGLALVYTARAEAHLALGDLDAAERDARTALFLGDPHGHYRLGQIYEQQGDLDAAERVYLAAVPGIVVMQDWDVGVYQRQGRITYLPQLQAPPLSNIEPYLALLRLYERQGRAAEAEQVRQALRAADPYREPGAAALP